MIKNHGLERFGPGADVLPYDHELYRPVVAYMYNGSGATWVVGDFLDYDLSVTSKQLGRAAKQHPASASGLECGIALEAATDGTWGKVQIAGAYGRFDSSGTVADGANVATATTIGQLLVGSATVGRAAVQSGTYAATHRVIAIALENASSNKCRVLLLTTPWM